MNPDRKPIMSGSRGIQMRADENGYPDHSLRVVLPCPICRHVWASDWHGLHSHVRGVHNVDLGELLNKPLVQGIARRPLAETQMPDTDFEDRMQRLADRCRRSASTGQLNQEFQQSHIACLMENASNSPLSSQVDLDYRTATNTQQKVSSQMNLATRRKSTSKTGRGAPTSKINVIKNSKMARTKRRSLFLRCPICYCVWASDWNGLCSHAATVHGMNLEKFPTIKGLLESRARRLSTIEVDMPSVRCQGNCDVDNQLHEIGHCPEPEITPQLDEKSSHDSTAHAEQEAPTPLMSSESDLKASPIGARREGRSLSDFGVCYNCETHPVRARSASLNLPQLENLYQAHRQLRARQELERKYKLQQKDKNQLLDLVRPIVEDKIAEIDYEVAKSLIGGYAVPPYGPLEALD